MGKMYVRIKDFIGGRLRGLCDRLSPRQRTATVLVAAALFALGNFYMIFRAVYDIGREDARREVIEIEPLDIPDFVPADTLSDRKVREMEEFFNQFNR
ncbi:conjugal transfer protein TraL [Alistipes sp. An116]|uniref:TraL conjugative transposon family protein n=1 Tax=Alistipes sp. An116 TaxID=1965546 RepID=UPI000B3AB46C|nr:TraL conjugative transposon family protein [Alistipes sp. An116]OUQ53674.1 conjugal transfer protein TraL [Alistipes sp. An116]